MSYHMNGLGIDISGGAGVSIGPGGVTVTPPSVSVTTSSTPSAPPTTTAPVVDQGMVDAKIQSLSAALAQLQNDAAGFPAIQFRVKNLVAWLDSIKRSSGTPSSMLWVAGDFEKSLVSVQQALVTAKVAAAVAANKAAAAAALAAAKAAAAKADAAQKAAAQTKLANTKAATVKPPTSTGKKIALGVGVLGTLAAIWYVIAGSAAVTAAAAIPNRRRARLNRRRK